MNVPDGWEHRKLGDVFVSRNDKSKQIKSSDYLESGVYPVVDQSEVFVCGYSDDVTKVISTNLPFVVFGDHTRHTKFIDFPFVCGADGTQLVKPKGEFNNRFFYYLVLKASQLIGNHGYDRHFKHLKNFPVVFPKSAAEQRQIARILSKVDEAISQTEQLIAKYRRLKTGLMQDLLTKGIDAHGNIRSEETHAFKDSPLGRIPAEWEVMKLGSIYDLKSGITPLRAVDKYFAHEGHNWVKSLDLNEDSLFDTEEKVTDFALQATSLKLMPINSVLVAMYGGWEQIGRTAILKKEAGTNQAITCLINSKVDMFPEYTQLFMQQNRWRWKQYAVSTRKDPNITKSDIEDFNMAVPESLEEQKNIANRILKVKNSVKSFSDNLAKLQSLKTGLMQDLLSGKVRVGQLIRETADV